MGRSLREQCPGGAFHITARTQGHEPWFKGLLEDRVRRILVEVIATSDAMLVADCIMPNHFHVVLRQGTRPLGWVMQPAMRRIALLVQQTKGVEGHVFERNFRSKLCENADHLRRSIVYTHINPKRGGLCDSLDAYEWSSHLRYVSEDRVGVTAIEVVHALRLFADRPDLSLPEQRRCYEGYVQWRIDKDAADAQGVPFEEPEPETASGDRYFAEFFRGGAMAVTKAPADLRDRAIRILGRIDGHITIDDVRGSYLRRPLYQVRRQLIAALLQAGFRVRKIARFLNVTDAAVSGVAVAMRASGVSSKL